MASIESRSAQLAKALILMLGSFVLSLGGADAAMPLTLTSSAFKSGAPIPSLYTCEGKDISPPLAWEGAPAGTKSLALIVDDPDAPDPKALAEDADKGGLPTGTVRGVADSRKAAYGGPCPPIGRHRYFHKLYALDTTLDVAQSTKAEIEAAMKGHVLAQAELIGTYQKGDR